MTDTLNFGIPNPKEVGYEANPLNEGNDQKEVGYEANPLSEGYKPEGSGL